MIFRRRSFPIFSFFEIRTCEIYKNYILQRTNWLFVNYLEDGALSEDKNKWFWGSRTRPKLPKSCKYEFEGFPIVNSKSYKFKLKRNKSTQLLNVSFIWNSPSKLPKNRKKHVNETVCPFFWISNRKSAFLKEFVRLRATTPFVILIKGLKGQQASLESSKGFCGGSMSYLMRGARSFGIRWCNRAPRPAKRRPFKFCIKLWSAAWHP